MENVCWAKNINNFYVNFDRTCQDHTFAVRSQVETPSDSQGNENGKCLLGKKTWTIFLWISSDTTNPSSAPRCQKVVPRNNPEPRKMDEGFIVQGGRDFSMISFALVCWQDGPTVAPPGKEFDWFGEGFKELNVIIFLGPRFFLDTSFSHCCSILAAWASKEQRKGSNMERPGQLKKHKRLLY